VLLNDFKYAIVVLCASVLFRVPIDLLLYFRRLIDKDTDSGNAIRSSTTMMTRMEME